MQPEHEFQYMFMDKLKRYVYVDETGSINFSAEVKPLKYTPDGWMTMALAYERNLMRHGILRTLSIPLKFVKDGAKILRYFRYKYGYDAELTMIIARFNTVNYVHELFFNGDVNFSTMEDNPTDVSVEILDGGINASLKAKMNTPYELDITPSVPIWHDGLKIKQETIFAVTDSDLFLDDPYWRYGSHLVDLNAVKQETNPNFASTQSVRRFKTTTSGIFPSGRYGLKVKVDTAVTIDYDFWMNIQYDYSTGTSPNPALRFFTDFRVYDAAGTSIASYFLLLNGGFGNHHLVGNLTINLLAGQSLFLHSRGNVIGVTGDATTTWDYSDGGSIDLKFFTRAAPTVVKGMFANDVYRELMNKINGQYPTRPSYLLEGRKDIVIISGDALRGFDNPKIKITLSDFLDSINTPTCCGFGTRYNQPVLENRRFFYQDLVSLSLGEVKDFKPLTATDFGSNQWKIGYPPFDYDEINGRDEPNTTVVWGTTVKRMVAELDLVSKIRGDMYGAEFARVNYSQKKTTDASVDNDNFFLIVENGPRIDGYYHLSRPTYDLIEGLIQPDTAYNLPISPRRCLTEHESWLHGTLQNKETDVVTFQTMNKNPLLRTEDTFTGPLRIVDEDADFPVGSMFDPFFQMDYVTFKTTTPVNMQQLLDNFWWGLIQFSWKGVNYLGWIISVAFQPGNLEEKEFKVLIKSPTNLNVNSDE